MIDKLLKFAIKKLVNLYYKRNHFLEYSWGIDEHIDLHIISEESYSDTHRFGIRQENKESIYDYYHPYDIRGFL